METDYKCRFIGEIIGETPGGVSINECTTTEGEVPSLRGKTRAFFDDDSSKFYCRFPSSSEQLKCSRYEPGEDVLLFRLTTTS